MLKKRKLKIRETTYYWTASKNSVLYFSVIREDDLTRKMVVNFKKGRERPITPGLVRRYVEKAVAEGWEGSVTYWHGETL